MYVPNHKNIVVYATGWAAKFTPFLGKIMSDLALDGHTDFRYNSLPTGTKLFQKTNVKLEKYHE